MNMTQRILADIAANDYPRTSLEIAQSVNLDRNRVASRLSKMRAYGEISGETRKAESGPPLFFYRARAGNKNTIIR